MTEWWDDLSPEDRIEEARKLVGVYTFRIRGIPRTITVRVEEYSTGLFQGWTDCDIQSPLQATRYRHTNPSLTAQEALNHAITGITHFLPRDPELLKETKIFFDDGEVCMCQAEAD